ncbi:MAG TPA: response regulator [Candidatus Dormibacteraeota bacterium]
MPDWTLTGNGIAVEKCNGFCGAPRDTTRIRRVPPVRARILLAEDEASVAQAVITRFTEMGHEVRWARAVREVRAELPEFSPDLLILDVTLDTDGLELFQAIRFAPEHPPAGVVILTESGDIAMRERAQQLGAAAVVTKPLRGDELAEVVEDLLTFI